MIRRLFLYLAGRLITPETVQHFLDLAIAEAKAAARRTATPLDDEAVAAIERLFDLRALAEKLARWLEARIRT